MFGFNNNEPGEQNNGAVDGAETYDNGAEFDPWDSEAPVYRSLGFDTQQMSMGMEGSDNMRSLGDTTGAMPTMGMTSMYDDEAPVYRSLSVMPQLSMQQPSLGMPSFGMPSLSSTMSMAKPSLGMGKPSLGGGGGLGMGMPSIHGMSKSAETRAASGINTGAGQEALVVSLPLPCFYQLERTNHSTNPRMDDASLARCISEALAELGADFTLKAEKAKWKVTAFDHGARSEYRVRLFSRADQLQGQGGQQEKIIEFQRRQGGAVHFHRSYAEAVNGLRKRGALQEVTADDGSANPQAPTVLLDPAALSASLPPCSSADILAGLTTLVSAAASARWLDARKEAVESLTRLSPQPQNRHPLLSQTECISAMNQLLLDSDPSPLNGHVKRCAVTVLADLFTASPGDNVTTEELAPHLAAVSTPAVLGVVVQMAVGSATGSPMEPQTDTQTRRECCRLLLAVAKADGATAVDTAVRGNAAATAWVASISEGSGPLDARLSGLVQQLQTALQ